MGLDWVAIGSILAVVVSVVIIVFLGFRVVQLMNKTHSQD